MIDIIGYAALALEAKDGKNGNWIYYPRGK
jgi:hypothetical protein